MAFLAGIQANRNSKRIARGIRERGQADMRLRRLASDRLRAKIRQSAVSRDVKSTSQTTIDLERQAAILEGMDIDRIKFRAELEAHQVRLQGKAALANSISQTVGQVTSLVSLGATAGRLAGSDAALETLREQTLLGDTSMAISSAPTFDTTGGFVIDDVFGVTGMGDLQA